MAVGIGEYSASAPLTVVCGANHLGACLDKLIHNLVNVADGKADTSRSRIGRALSERIDFEDDAIQIASVVLGTSAVAVFLKTAADRFVEASALIDVR